VLFYVLFVCKCILPLGDNPTAVNKYIKYIKDAGIFKWAIPVDIDTIIDGR